MLTGLIDKLEHFVFLLNKIEHFGDFIAVNLEHLGFFN